MTAVPTPSPPGTTQLASSLEALPGSILAWATKPGQKTSEGLATMLAVPITALVTFVAAFFISHSLLTNEQAQAAIDATVPTVSSAAAAWAVKGYAAARATVKAEAIRLHLLR